jgi:hypothetical protein
VDTESPSGDGGVDPSRGGADPSRGADQTGGADQSDQLRDLPGPEPEPEASQEEMSRGPDEDADRMDLQRVTQSGADLPGGAPDDADRVEHPHGLPAGGEATSRRPSRSRGQRAKHAAGRGRGRGRTPGRGRSVGHGGGAEGPATAAQDRHRNRGRRQAFISARANRVWLASSVASEGPGIEGPGDGCGVMWG